MVPPGRRPARRRNSNASGVNDLWRAISRRERGGGGPSAFAGASPHCHVGTDRTGTGAFGGDGGTAGAAGCCRASQPRNSAHISSHTPVTGTPGWFQPWRRRACQSSHTPTPRSPAASSGSSTGRRCHSSRARAGAVHTPVVAGLGAGHRPAPVTAGRDWTGLRHAQSSPLSPFTVCESEERREGAAVGGWRELGEAEGRRPRSWPGQWNVTADRVQLDALAGGTALAVRRVEQRQPLERNGASDVAPRRRRGAGVGDRRPGRRRSPPASDCWPGHRGCRAAQRSSCGRRCPA